jgi:hypothetical protein
LSNNFLEVGYNFLDLVDAAQNDFNPLVGKNLAGDAESRS